MSKFIKNLTLFLSGLPLLLPRPGHATLSDDPAMQGLNEPDAVPLRPLNRDIDNLFAGHSSHSSHASHASHYSGSGGGYSPTDTAPVPAPPPSTENLIPTFPPPASSATYGSSRPRPLSAVPGGTASEAGSSPPSLTRTEKLKLQIMRVQIKLHSLGLYDGRIDGVRNVQTIESLKHFQVVKGLPEDGMMTTPTLNALGVPAAN